MRVQGIIAASGYRSITPPSDVSKLDADDLLQGGSALRVAGNVTGGIILDAPPKDTDPKDDDEDKDGVKDANEGTASVTSYGSAAAFQIGASDRATTIGAVSGNAQGHGLVINGAVSGSAGPLQLALQAIDLDLQLHLYRAVGLEQPYLARSGQSATSMRGMSKRSVVRAYQPRPCIRPTRSSFA